MKNYLYKKEIKVTAYEKEYVAKIEFDPEFFVFNARVQVGESVFVCLCLDRKDLEEKLENALKVLKISGKGDKE